MSEQDDRSESDDAATGGGQLQAAKWGELPPPERIAELEARLADWAQMSGEARGKLHSAFDPSEPQGWKASQGGPGVLSGADVFYLAARSHASSAEEVPSVISRSLRPEGWNRPVGVEMPKLHLEGACFTGALLAGADLIEAHLEDAFLDGAHLEGASLEKAHLESAFLPSAHLEKAFLFGAHLEGTNLSYASLEGALLANAHLEGTNLSAASLEGAQLTGASFNKTSRLNDAVLTDASFDQVIFDNTSLTVVDWSLVEILGDEHAARKRKDTNGEPKTRNQRLDDYKAAVRANRVLAVALQAQGLSEDADRFAYRAKVLQRRVQRLQRKLGAYLLSLLLAALAGYGYQLRRILVAYCLALTAFTTAYFVAGQWFGGSPLSPYESFIVSLTAIHGRVFITTFGLDSMQSLIAAIESVVGIVIEGVFVAMLIQRFFGR